MATKKTPAKKPAAKKPRVTVSAKVEPKEASPVGRPSDYRPEYAERAYEFCLLGATDTFLAERFKVAVSTIKLWEQNIPEFSDALARGKDIADAKVAKSLYHRAIGYEHAEDDIRSLSVGGGRSEIVITPTIKRYPPDTGAATLWLKNRQSKFWREKVEVEHSGNLTVKSLTDDQLMALAMKGVPDVE